MSIRSKRNFLDNILLKMIKLKDVSGPNDCHLCKNELFTTPILQLKGMPKAAQYYPNKNEFAEDKGVTLDIRQCSGCGLVQHKMKPVDYYKEVITAATLSGKSRQSRLDQIKDIVDKYGLNGKNAIEIGSGKGELLDVLEEAGLKATGIEAGSNSVDIALNANRNMVKGYIGDVKKIDGGPFDAFICLNYLEHLPEPGAIIKNIYNNTTDNAVGYITVPNLEYLLKTKCFYEFVADHVSYFTQSTLKFAFESNGFEALDCKTINNDNDVAVTVKKRNKLNIKNDYADVEMLIKDLKRIISEYRSKGKKIAVWGAGHRTLALLSLSDAKEIEYIVDSAKFKHGKFSPVLHLKIVSPDHLKQKKVDLVIIMVPGLYPGEVLKTLRSMDVNVDIAMLKDNRMEFEKNK